MRHGPAQNRAAAGDRHQSATRRVAERPDMLRPAVLPLLLAAAAAQLQPDCDLSQPEALSDCVKQLLEGLRNDVHRRSDPLRLDDSVRQRGRVTTEITNVKIHGLSAYDIRHLDVSFPANGTRLAVAATIAWPRLRGNLHARAKAEKRVWRKKLRASVSADVEVRVDDPVGSLEVTVQIDIDENGTVTATPHNTSVTVTLGDIDVDVRLGGAGRWVDRLIGNPTSKITELVAEEMWKRKWRPKVEREAREALEEAVVEKLGAKLSELLMSSAELGEYGDAEPSELVAAEPSELVAAEPSELVAAEPSELVTTEPSKLI